MEPKDKELLLKDLCVRMPYFVKVQIENEIVTLDSICNDDGYYFNFIGNNKEGVSIENIKLYLFPLSSMTEEQKQDLLLTVVGKEGLKLFSVTEDGIVSNDKKEQSLKNFSLNNVNFSNKNIKAHIDWLLKNHFDICGLIPMGLAIDATGLNIY